MVDRYDDNEDLILFLRLEIVRLDCDRLGGPELIPISTGMLWSGRKSCESPWSEIFHFVGPDTK